MSIDLKKKTPKFVLTEDGYSMPRPRFELKELLQETGRAMTDLADRLSSLDEARPLNRREIEMAKTAITGRQLSILDEMTMFVLADSEEDVESAMSAVYELMEMKREL